jgi:bacteriocin biosynthesis cyclodehydratase domain-containing protein
MLSRPRLRSSFEVVPLPPGQLFLLDEQRQVILEGEVFVRLAPLLDGRRSLADIAGAASADFALHEVLLALGHLEKQGCLVEGPTRLTEPEAAWFDSLPGEPAKAERAEAYRISVRALGAVSPEPMLEALAASGLEVGDSGDLNVVLTDDYLRAELEDVNRDALERMRPFMLVRPVGMKAWIGPIFVPGATGCWRCLAQRLRANRQMENYILARTSGVEPLLRAHPALPSTVQLALDLAVTELRRWLVQPDSSSLAGRLLTFDLLRHEAREHVLVRRPQCPACGDPLYRRPRKPSPVVLNGVPKRFRADGGHRSVPPAETFERYRHHVSPITGAVSELRPALGRHDAELTPCYVAGHNFSVGVDSVVFLKESLRGVSGGKGSTVIQAKVSGLCEAIERYSGIYSGEEYIRRGSYEGLRPRAIHPNECMGFSEEQYRNRQPSPNQLPSRYVLVPRPLDPALEVDWSPVWSLTRQEERLLPTAYCYYGHPEFKDGWCIPDSNGCAAGNTLEEAILQGFMELVERDGVALWWYNRIRRQGVDLDSFELPYVRAVQEYYASIGRGLWVLDITSDLGITTLACVSARTTGPTQDVLVGFGAHFDPRLALLRAVTEVNQFLPTISYALPDGTTLYLFGDDAAKHWWTTARVEELDYLRADPGRPPKAAADFDDPSTDDLAEDVRLCVELARKHDLEVSVLDQTRPDIGLNVARVVVPGLCHFWRRLGFRRLYEVPVAMGWLERPLRPDELNPYTIFF